MLLGVVVRRETEQEPGDLGEQIRTHDRGWLMQRPAPHLWLNGREFPQFGDCLHPGLVDRRVPAGETGSGGLKTGGDDRSRRVTHPSTLEHTFAR